LISVLKWFRALNGVWLYHIQRVVCHFPTSCEILLKLNCQALLDKIANNKSSE
jgi:hypothetical protein